MNKVLSFCFLERVIKISVLNIEQYYRIIIIKLLENLGMCTLYTLLSLKEMRKIQHLNSNVLNKLATPWQQQKNKQKTNNNI